MLHAVYPGREHSLSVTITVENLGSGSSGNALLVRAGGSALLVDCGVPKRTVLAALAAHGLSAHDLAGIAVSHEHGDHVRSLDAFSGTVPVLATGGTLAALGSLGRDGVTTDAGTEQTAGPFAVRALPVSHDASEPCGFTIVAAGHRITVLTDLGCPPPGLAEVLVESDLIVLESNYDPHMLACGPYPARLKRRIVADTGHLSNEQCGEVLAKALRTSHRDPVIWLAHLSRTNNRPAVARDAVTSRLSAVGIALTVDPMARAGGQRWEPGNPRPTQLRLGF
jgi:phosphoribosyl 1,2-cyclic phosphodiesterase